MARCTRDADGANWLSKPPTHARTIPELALLLIAVFAGAVSVKLRQPGLIAYIAAGLPPLSGFVANLAVARRILRHPARLRPAFVEVPPDLESDLAISLTPGTVSARLSEDRRTRLVHCLDAPDPEAVRDDIKARYEAPLKEVFESC